VAQLGQLLPCIGQGKAAAKLRLNSPRAKPLFAPGDRLRYRGLGQRQLRRLPAANDPIPRLLRKSREPSKSGSFAIRAPSVSISETMCFDSFYF